MTSRSQNISVTRSVSLPGLLAFTSGCGLLFAQWKFSTLSEDWTDLNRRAFFLGASALILLGLHQLISGLFPQPGSGRVRRLNRHRVMLPAEGLVYLLIMAALFVGSLLGRNNMLMLVFSLMAGPFVLNGWITFSMLKRLGVSRQVPKRAMAGTPISVGIALTNRKRLSSWLMALTDRIANAREILDARVLFPRVPPRDQRSTHYQLRLMQRGIYEFGPIHLTTRFPLGLVERGVVFEMPDEIIVHPRIGRLTSKWQREQLTAAELVRWQEPRRGAFDDEFHRIREFRPGDNPRAIHWRTTARRNELMVREFHQSRDQNLTVLLDLWLPRRPVDDDFERVELAVSFAATVCVDFMKVGRDSDLRLLTCGRELTRWQGSAGPPGIEPILDILAVVQPDASPDVEQLFDSWLAERSPNTRTLLITTRKRRANGFEGFEELNAYAESRTVPEILSEIQTFEAAQSELEPFFQPD